MRVYTSRPVSYKVRETNTGRSDMRERLISLAVILFATTAIASVANSQASYPCVNDAPNPYHQVPWTASPRALGPVNSVFVDVRDDVWVADRCGTPVEGPEGCAGSGLPTVRKFDPSGKTLWAFRPGELVSPHGCPHERIRQLAARHEPFAGERGKSSSGNQWAPC
jgi:hypothetical protein